MPETRQCKTCGKGFTPRVKTSTYCSKTCAASTQRRVTTCPVCGTEFTKRSKTCSTKCAAVLRANTMVATLTKECEACGKPFAPSNAMSKYCDGPHYKSCVVCHKDFEAHPASRTMTCSSSCAGVLINTPESLAKRQQTNLEKFGDTSYTKTDEFKERSRTTQLERYGEEHYLRTTEGKEKLKQTNMERYGHDWGLQSLDIRAKAKVTNMERYGVPNPSMVPEFRVKANETLSRNINNGTLTHHRTSKVNKALAETLHEAFGTDVQFEKPLESFATDLYLPEADLFIDYHPVISHNLVRSFACVLKSCPQPCPKHPPLSRDYHYRRAMAAREADKTLLQWFQHDNTNAMLQLIHGKVGKGFTHLSARKLQLITLTQPQANAFLAATHVQGAAKKQTHCYGLVQGDELQAVATFGPARFGNPAQYEFIRFAVSPSVIIHGGSGRLFKKFIAETAASSVVSYLDFNHTTRQHTFLDTLGFTPQKDTGPNTVWYRAADDKKVSENTLLRLGADTLLGTHYGSRESCGLSNHDILLMEGFLPVATSGNRVYRWSAEPGA